MSQRYRLYQHESVKGGYPQVGTIYRFKAFLSGWIGGPGQNTWHVLQAGELGGMDQSDAEGVAADIQAVYDACRSEIVTGVKIDISPVVEGFDIASGQLTSVIGITPPAQVAALGSVGALSRATQATARLATDAIRGNRLMQGRHFIGPIGGGSLGADGQLTTSTVNTIQAAYNGMLDVAGNARLAVWGQPRTVNGQALPGVAGYVQSVLVNRTPGTLRSRKV